jgi:hypothetical protein
LGSPFFWILILLSTLLSAGISVTCFAQQPQDPWTPNQHIEPAVLARQLSLPENQRPVIIDVGPAGVIKDAKVTGPVQEKDGMKNLKNMLQHIARTKEVVIYCGCCPFAKCPNVRPAFSTLLGMGFKNPRLLNLSHNLKADWIDKGYPLEDQ